MNQTGSQADYARHRGVSRAAVCKQVKDGRVVTVDGQIDFAASDALLASKIDPARGGKSGTPLREPKAAGAPPERDDGQPITFAEARTEREYYQAQLSKLEYETAVGKLAESERVIAAVAAAFSMVPQSLRQMRDRLSSRLAAESDPRKVALMLGEEHDALLQALADAVDAMPEQFTATQQ